MSSPYAKIAWCRMDNRFIYAVYNDETICVYQAYSDRIADEAIKLGTFGSSFKLDRMTWIKPSFLWMMYRSGWATKEGQNRILAIDMKREGFELIVRNAVLSSFSQDIYGTYENWKACLVKSSVRCQWDPDRDIYGSPLERRTIQLGIKGDMVGRYVSEWIMKITDVTQNVEVMRTGIKAKRFDENILPVEREYKFTDTLHTPYESH